MKSASGNAPRSGSGEALEPIRAKAEKNEFLVLQYLLSMASLEARDLSKKSD